jgi:hypothetical protein
MRYRRSLGRKESITEIEILRQAQYSTVDKARYPEGK